MWKCSFLGSDQPLVLALPEQTYHNLGSDCNHNQEFIWMLGFKENQKLVVSELGRVAHSGSRERGSKDCFWLHCQSEASLACRKPCLKTKITTALK